MQKQIVESIIHANKPLTSEEVAMALVVRHGFDESTELSTINESLRQLQRSRLVVNRDGKYALTAIGRKLMGKTPCHRTGGNHD